MADSLQPQQAARQASSDHPKPSPRALAEWESLFEKLPAADAPSEDGPEAAAELAPAEAVAPAITPAPTDRPASPFHVYEWVLDKLRENPAATYRELQRKGEVGNFRVAEGHYKRARRVVDGELPAMSSQQLDALVQETLEIVRAPLAELRKFREAAREIAQICDDALSALGDDDSAI